MVSAQRVARVIAPSVQTTVQDLGRRDVARFGVSPAGAVDWYSARAANVLVGNPDGAAVIENTLTGATFELACAARIAVTGASAALTIAGSAAAGWRAYDVEAGAAVGIGAADRGARSYLAIDGGVEVPLILGSASTDLGAGFGGHGGRALRAGDVLALGDVLTRFLNAPLSYAPAAIPQWNSSVTLRVLPGPHRASLSGKAWRQLFERSYAVSSRSTRQGIALDGEALELDAPTDVISAGAYAGCVQITSGGLPMILLAEHQTTGGYATAACIIAADVPQAGQLRPGVRVRFALASRPDAAHVLTAMHRLLRAAG